MNQNGGNRKLIIGAVVGLILGLLLGMLLFWGLLPPKMGNPQTYDLADEAKVQFVKLVADSYALDKDLNRSQQFLGSWSPEETQKAISGAVASYEAEGRSDKAVKMNDLQLALGLTAAPVAAETPVAEQEPVAGKGLVDRLKIPCLVFILALLVLLLGWIGLRIARQRRARGAGEVAAPLPVARPEAEMPLAEEWKGVGQPPLGHFITTYKLGEDTYDESFSIETAAGEFLGECGVGISELIGKGEPDSVTAFEVWLFDKSDIRTVTKVLMSAHAYSDEQLRARLAPKGEAVLAEVGVPFVLETTGLQVHATVSDLQYGEGQTPPKSFFRQLTLELVAVTRPAV